MLPRHVPPSMLFRFISSRRSSLQFQLTPLVASRPSFTFSTLRGSAICLIFHSVIQVYQWPRVDEKSVPKISFLQRTLAGSKDNTSVFLNQNLSASI